MERCCRVGRIWDAVWFLFCLGASSAWCLTAARELGVTFDEPVYIARGLEGWRTGSHRGLIRMGTMPLPVDLETLPVYLWERWRGVPFDLTTELEHILPVCRAVNLAFWGLLLTYAWLAGRQLAGPWGARLAVGFLAFEPNLLAHAALATTDLAVSACLLALVYHFRTAREAGWLYRVGVPMLWFAGAVLAKASGLAFGLLCMLAVELERLAAQGAFASAGSTQAGPRLRRALDAWRPWRRDVAQIFGGGLVLVLLYCGSDWQPEPSFVAWARKLPEGWTNQVLVWVAEHLRIFSNAGEGLVRQIKHNLHGHGMYLLGRSHHRALWYYFPVLLTIKLCLPVLLAPAFLGIFRFKALANWASLAAATLLVFSLTCRVQIGVRLVLPLVVLALVGLAAAGVHAWQAQCPGWPRRLLTATAGAGLAWMAGAAVTAWPHGLCYSNELWGDRSQAYLRVSDSNYDWGQGLPELLRWQERQGVTTMHVWYFGTDPLLKKPPLQEVPFHVLPLAQPDDILALVRGNYLAASTTMLHGAAGNSPGHRLAARFFAMRQPVARTTTFLIYDFTLEPETDRPGTPPILAKGDPKPARDLDE
jgi:hypothetical protein